MLTLRSVVSSCYLCGKPADGPDDHVPPEVLFRGEAGRTYKSPEIITIPSCIAHNEGTSGDDEKLAWIMSGAGRMCSSAALDVYQTLFSHVKERIWKDREFADKRLAHTGSRILRDPKDYDESGDHKEPLYDDDYVERIELAHRERWIVHKRSLQKIAAGLFFHATRGRSLGVLRTSRLTVVVPDFKQVEPTLTLTGLAVDEAAYFAGLSSNWNKPPWQSIASGSPEVFQCEIALNPQSLQFAMRMRFFGAIRVWVIWVTALKTYEETACGPDSTADSIEFFRRLDAGFAAAGRTVASDVGPILADDYLPFLIAVRRIIEARDTIEHRIKKLYEMPIEVGWQEFVSKHGGIDGIVERFFPKFMNLAAGLDTPNRIAATSDETLLGIKGIGPAKLKAIRERCAGITENRDADRVENVIR